MGRREVTRSNATCARCARESARENAPPNGWFDEIADFLGPAHLRNAFTKGTEQEVAFLVDDLGLAPGTRVLDVGCGPGRHALSLARRGISVHGIDRADAFLELAREVAHREQLAATFEHVDVRDLAAEAEFDAAICLCQGGFGLLGGDDEEDVMRRIVNAVRPGGPVAVSAFSAAFALRFLEPGETFDPATGVLHEHSTVRGPDGAERTFDLWTTCFTPRELRLMARQAGIGDVEVYGVTPGDYDRRPPAIDRPELLLVGRRHTAA
jgi:2-polyprenyl-3-methyl-5-hydroxy-6-metoxy-1,4-benzoquinol methylase